MAPYLETASASLQCGHDASARMSGSVPSSTSPAAIRSATALVAAVAFEIFTIEADADTGAGGRASMGSRFIRRGMAAGAELDADAFALLRTRVQTVL